MIVKIASVKEVKNQLSRLVKIVEELEAIHLKKKRYKIREERKKSLSDYMNSEMLWREKGNCIGS